MSENKMTIDLRARAAASVRVGSAAAYAMIAEVRDYQRQMPSAPDDELSKACRAITDGLDRLDRAFGRR